MTKTLTPEEMINRLRVALARAIEERNVAMEEAYKVMLENEHLRSRSVA
jgi:hypothetical protein